ncbi:uncharacterized protein LOC134540726 isoform X1 [Bacillus rossius redtenbacheri]|uniref:uncharacterized protein LOC134540726 isoform X1 n=1 Tax=Bacillus rossius redtenbacheri TaxID=93214 RepID=UPI002FDDC8E1
MEYKRPDELHSNIEEDACGIIEEGEICNEKTALSEISKEINQTYVEQLAKLNEQYDSPEVRTKLLYSWIAELLDQNALLVETVSELETAAVHRVALLEDRLQRSSVSVREYVARAQAPDGQSVATLCSLVAQLEADVGSLLELVRRAMRDGRWDLRGLTFHRVAYRDIFGPSSGLPPPAAPKREEPKKPPEYETELRKLTSEVELWKMRAEKAEAEARAAWDTTRPGAERGDLDRPRRLPAETAAEQARAPGPGPDDARQARETGGRETAAADRSEKLQRELDRANGLAAERAEQIRLLTLRLDGTEQRAGAQLGDARRRVLELEGELARAQSGVLVRNRLIQGMRKEMKLYMSQHPATKPSHCDTPAAACTLAEFPATPGGDA